MVTSDIVYVGPPISRQASVGLGFMVSKNLFNTCRRLLKRNFSKSRKGMSNFIIISLPSYIALVIVSIWLPIKKTAIRVHESSFAVT